MIRPTAESDWEILREVRLRALSDTPLAFGSTYAKESAFTDQQWRQRASQRSGTGSAVTFLAFDTEHVCCGIVGCFTSEDEPDCRSIVSMWVAPSVRRQGVGRQLLQKAEDWAIGQGASKLVLDVTEGNTPAIECYRRFGFEFTGQSSPYENDPKLRELWMVKKCPPKSA